MDENQSNYVKRGQTVIERKAMADNISRQTDTELTVPRHEMENLVLLSRSDTLFAVIYGVLFLWGLVLTLISI